MRENANAEFYVPGTLEPALSLSLYGQIIWLISFKISFSTSIIYQITLCVLQVKLWKSNVLELGKLPFGW